MTDTNRSSSTSPNTANGTAKPAGTRSRRGKVAKAASSARKAVEQGIETGAAKARASVKAVRQQADAAVDAGAAAIDSAPLSALAGAIALGAVAAALIPNSRRELAAVGPVGARIRDSLDDAFTAAKSAGSDVLTAKGLTSAAATAGIGELLGSIVKAAIAASSAADDSMRKVKPSSNQTPPTQASSSRAR